MGRRLVCVIAFAILSLNLSGCWDRVEIDQRGFVVGVGIDRPPQEEDDSENGRTSMRYRGTYQIIKPRGLSSTGGSGGMSGAGQKDTYMNIAAEENSIPAITSKISSMVGRSPYFEHLQLVVLSGSITREKKTMTDVLDYFLRDVEMRRDILIMATPGKASDILGVEPMNEQYPVDYLNSTSKNYMNSSFMLPVTRIGDLHESLLKKDGYSIQAVHRKGSTASLAGAAVFEGKSNLLLGFLSGPETQGLNLMRGQVKGGILQTVFDGGTIDLEIEFAEHRIQADIRSPRDMSFTFTITVEGMLDKSTSDRPVDKENEILDMQQKLEAEIRARCRQTIEKLQNKYREDVIGLSAWLRRNHNGIWNQIKDDWNETLFPNVEINVNAIVEVRRMGNIIMTE